MRSHPPEVGNLVLPRSHHYPPHLTRGQCQMCQMCDDKFTGLACTRAAAEASWHCPVCGDVKFKKEQSPEEAPVANYEFLIPIFFVLAFAGCVITAIICTHK